ncbi:GerAB/ArcD/ProY family transporter [Paenibacillus sp. LHD-117]|uniref:GerAB/ArcD/ProY family transporter n=1 Tax=Paenibacillus sp. LHD-117 TaxID=3071412 RepID=UPI0027DF95A6|nr:GerAB/ArcD/ProY family transporter [Paenibacillus sp. LHD-117]MDQ6419525.1 GerAB/ArcD/ProY family transporter [Paenibacillus sp. LHD-117]
MEKAKIGPGQLFSLIVLFDMGTSILRVLAMKAEKDAWLTILLGSLGGMALFWVYVSLYRRYPELPLTGYVRKILGKWTGGAIGLLYVLFFIHGAARDLREGGDLIASSVLDQTPVIAINAIMIVSIGYVLTKGIEVLARTGQIFLFILIVLGVISSFLLFFAGVIDVKRLLPVLGNGLGPVIETTLKQTFQFPHEEVVCFTMVLPYLNRMRQGIRAGFVAVLLSSFLLSYTTSLNIAVLGADIAARSTFPLRNTISLINIGEFIQRLDVIVVLTLIIGDFFKVAIFYYAAVMSITDVFRISDYRKLVQPAGIIILLISVMLSGDFAEQIEEGDILLYTMFMLFGAILPGFLLIAAMVRQRLGASR